MFLIEFSRKVVKKRSKDQEFCASELPLLMMVNPFKKVDHTFGERTNFWRGFVLVQLLFSHFGALVSCYRTVPFSVLSISIHEDLLNGALCIAVHQLDEKIPFNHHESRVVATNDLSCASTLLFFHRISVRNSMCDHTHSILVIDIKW